MIDCFHFSENLMLKCKDNAFGTLTNSLLWYMTYEINMSSITMYNVYKWHKMFTNIICIYFSLNNFWSSRVQNLDIFSEKQSLSASYTITLSSLLCNKDKCKCWTLYRTNLFNYVNLGNLITSKSKLPMHITDTKEIKGKHSLIFFETNKKL